MVSDLQKAGRIEPTTGHSAGATLLLAKKDADSNYRDRTFSGDYRALNATIKPDRYAMPLSEDVLDLIDGCGYFNVMDMRQRFYQIEVVPEDKHKTAF